jgi:hypothetical protein
MVQFLPQNALQAPNMNVDFSPISNAIDSNRRNALAMNEDRRAQESHDLRMQTARASAGRGGSENVARLGAVAGQIAGLPDDSPLKQQAWGKWLAEHGDGDLTPEERDYRTGPALAAIAAGKYQAPDPQEQAKNALDMDYKRAQINSLNRKEEPDPITQMLLQRMQGGQGQPQQAPAQPKYQPQSMPMGQSGPRLSNVSNPQAAGMPAPQYNNPMIQSVADPAPQQAPAQSNMVDTPYGKMSREEATQLGGAMLLKPNLAPAGKALLEAVQGGGAGNGLGTVARNQVDEKALGQIDLAGRLDSIAAKFKPEFLTYETGLKMGVTGMLDSFEATRGSISPQDAKQLEEYTAFKQDATNNLSEYIKFVTGAAMGIQEEGRIRKGMPDPEKDSPRQFASKLNSSVQQTKLALARYNFLKRNGYDETTISNLAKQDGLSRLQPIEGMQGIINQRLDQAAKQIKQQNPSIDDMSLKQEIRRIQKQEFGI